MATSNDKPASTKSIHPDKTNHIGLCAIDDALNKISCAGAMISTLGIYISECDNGSGVQPVSCSFLSSSLEGIAMLLESATSEIQHQMVHHA